mgnify:CR=1 FL=1
MTIIYLKNAKTLQDLKKLYFTLAKKYHPDITDGDLETMQTINNEYDYLKSRLPNKKKETEQETVINENVFSMDAFRDVLNKILKYPRITVDIVGSWLWIYGNGTFAIKDDILYNQLHCKYSRAQKKFYWFSGIENVKYRKKGGYLKNAIDRYGKYTIESEATPQLT